MKHKNQDDGDDGAEMLAGGEFGDHTAVLAVYGELAGDDGGEDARFAFKYGGGGFVAGTFDR